MNRTGRHRTFCVTFLSFVIHVLFSIFDGTDNETKPFQFGEDIWK